MELEELKKVIKGTSSFEGEIKAVLSTVDWEALSRQIADKAFEANVRPGLKIRLRAISAWLFQPKLRPVFAGVLLGIMLGFAAAYLVFRAPQATKTKASKFFASHEFLERVELEMARRETLDYLDRSQYLLLGFVQSSPEVKGFSPNAFSADQARDLLSKKKYLNRELDKFQMAKAKEICDQIELLFIELTQISDRLPQEELLKIQDLIQEKQLLLKIKLVKKELEESEV